MYTFWLDFDSGASVSLTCWDLHQEMAVGNPNEGARVTGMTNEKSKPMVG